MGLYEYLILSDEKQWDTLWDKGKFITHRVEGKSKFTVYAIGKFFVEVELGKSDKIIGKKVFKYGEILDKYSPNLKNI